MNRKQLDILEACVNKLAEGSSLEECLNEYPDMTVEMQGMLRTAAVLNSLKPEQVPSEAINQSRSKMIVQAKVLAAERTLTKANPSKNWFTWFLRLSSKSSSYRPIVGRVGLILGITLLLIIFSRGLVITSAKSLPGDSLYPVKIAVEDLHIHLILDQEVRDEYEINYEQQRVDEVRKLLDLKRSRSINFQGAVQAIENDDYWLVDGITIRLSAATNYLGGASTISQIKPGMIIEVEGQTTNQGWVIANAIQLKEYQLDGIVEQINASSWTVGNKQIKITTSTSIEGGISVGDEVVVDVQPTGTTLVALSIHLAEQPGEIPEIEPTEITPQIDETPESLEDDQLAPMVSSLEHPEIISPTEDVKPQETPESDHVTEYHVLPPQTTPRDGESERLDNPELSQTPEPADLH